MYLLLLYQKRNIIVRVRGNATIKTGAQLGLPDKGRAIKGLVVCWSMARINDLWDGSMDKRKVRSQVPCCGLDGNQAQVPQQPIDSFHIISS